MRSAHDMPIGESVAPSDSPGVASPIADLRRRAVRYIDRGNRRWASSLEEDRKLMANNPLTPDRRVVDGGLRRSR